VKEMVVGSQVLDFECKSDWHLHLLGHCIWGGGREGGI
jgi:hypothetical protein